MSLRHAICLISIILCQQAVQADMVTFGSGGNQFTMAFVPIGNPGNAADTTGSPNPAGAVPYSFSMGKFEVSEDMINKASSAGSLGITMDSRGANKPATSVTWNEAARFVNWLNTSEGFQAAYSFPTNPGDAGYVVNQNIELWSSAEAWQAGGENLFRHKDAHFFLPSFDEWYKAAYYDPAGASYFNFPTGSDTAPTAVASGTGAGTAVYEQSFATGPADITQAGGLSPYGTMGQGGNVFEWEESEFDLINNDGSSVRGVRGGFWFNISGSLSASFRSVDYPTGGFNDVGFRVASIPEPSPMLYGSALLLGLMWWKRIRS